MSEFQINNAELQEAIDKTRAWLNPQSSTSLTPSLKAKEDAVACLSELQKIQVFRAGLITKPPTLLKD